MKNKKQILAAIAAMSVLSSVAGLNTFAANEKTEETAVTVAAEETTEAVEEATEAVEDTTEAAPVVEEDGEKPEPPAPPVASEEDGEKPEPPAAPEEDAEKPAKPIVLDVTDLLDQIRSFIDANKIDILTDDIIENWDNIKKVDVHFDTNEKPEAVETTEDGEVAEKPAKPAGGPTVLNVTDLFNSFRGIIDINDLDFVTDELKDQIENVKDVTVHVHFAKADGEKPEPPVPPVAPADGEKPEPPAPPVAIEDGEKPEPPAPPVAPEDGEKPEPPAPPVAPADGEKPEPPAPPVAPEAPKGPAHEHLGPKEREALKAAQAEAESATEASAETETAE